MTAKPGGSRLTVGTPLRHTARKIDRRTRRFTSVLTLAALAGAWQLLSYVFPTQRDVSGTTSPLVPGWGWIATHALPAIANYGGNGFGLAAGTSGSYHEAFSVLLQNSAATWQRLLAGLFAGAACGTAVALALAWSRIARALLALPARILRAVPLLAMIPLFQLWFGVTTTGMIAFVAFGVGIVFFVGALTAIGNLPALFVDNARSLGASPFRIYRTVVLPGILPELRTAMILSLGVAWSAVCGAEFLGAQSGLGYIEVQARQFALLDRMIVVALLFLIYAAISYVVFEWLSRPLLAWMPRSGHELAIP